MGSRTCESNHLAVLSPARGPVGRMSSGWNSAPFRAVFLVREVVFREGCVMMGFDLLDISPPFFFSGMRFSRWEWAFRFIPEWRF